MMKYLTMIGVLMLALPVGAQIDAHAQKIELQKEVLQELLVEKHITPLEFNQRSAKLQRLEEASLSQQLNRSFHAEGSGGTSSILGTVMVGGAVQAGVNVYLLSVAGQVYVTSDTTDAAGEFTFSGLAAGDYYVLANDNQDDYINAMWSNAGAIQCQACSPDASSIISVVDSTNYGIAPMDLVVGASFNGQVLEGVNPVVGMYVNFRHINNQSYYANGQTDAAGNYSIKGVPAGDYYLRAQDASDIYIDAMYSTAGTVQCSNCVPDVNSTLSVVPGDVINGVDFDLVIGASLSGLLVDQTTAAPVETLTIALYDPNDLYNYWYVATTFDGFGNYSVSGIPAGDYKFYLEPGIENNMHIPEIYNNIQCNACATLLYDGAGNTVTLVNGVNTANIDFLVEQGASVSGILLNNDYPTETVAQYGLVYLFNDSNRILATAFLYGTDFDPSFDGQYKVGGLLPGMYFVQGGDLGREFFQRELFENIACPWSGCDRGAGGDPVVLGANEQRLGVNFLLNYGGKISGTISDATTGNPISPSNQNLYVQFYNSAAEVAGGGFIQADGTYISARALPPGTYSVRTGSMFSGEFYSPYVMQKYAPGGNIDCPGVTCDLTAGNVTVSAYSRLDPRDPTAEAAAATTTGIDFALSPGFSFSGTITELSSSAPIPDVHVLVYDNSGNFANWATTDSAGDFTVNGLPAGTYFALTNNGSNLPFMGVNQTASGGWIDILFDGTPCPGSACDVTTGDPIVLGGGLAGDGAVALGGAEFNFGMQTGGSISGQIRNASNQLPAGGVNVNVFNSSGDYFGSYESDNSGYYMTVGFPPGSYYLTTSNNGALIDVKFGDDYCFDQSCDPLDAEPLVISGTETLVNRDFNLKPDFIFKNGFN